MSFSKITAISLAALLWLTACSDDSGERTNSVDKELLSEVTLKPADVADKPEEKVEERVEERQKVRLDEERAAVLDTIAHINHINWVVNVIKTYNNAIVLEGEYEKISYGNLNLNRIPDEKTRERIEKISDTLHGFRKDEREMREWRSKFDDSRMRRMREYKLNKAKRVVELFKDTMAGVAKGDAGTVAETVWNVSHEALSLHNDYDNFVHEFDQQMRDKLFAFESDKIEKLHSQNKEMLEDQWRLVQMYHLNDLTMRVTDKDINALLNVLKDEDPNRIYTRLSPMCERFKLFPEFWYFLSCAAMQSGHLKEGVSACDTFFAVNRGIFRDDPMEGTVALNKAIMLDKSRGNRAEIKRCLDIVWKNNKNRNECDQDYVAAILYEKVLDDHANAEELLEHAIANMEAEMHLRQERGGSILGFGKTLGEYRKQLIQIQSKKAAQSVPAGEFVSCIDKLRYLACRKDADAWSVLGDEISRISLAVDADSSRRRRNEGCKAYASIPSSWFLPGDVPVELVLRHGVDDIARITGAVPKNGAHSRNVNSGDDTLFMFVLPEEPLANADSFKLEIRHGEFPVSLVFASNSLFKDGEEAYMKRFRISPRYGKSASWLPSLSKDLSLCEFTMLGKCYVWNRAAGSGGRDYAAEESKANWYENFKSHCPTLVQLSKHTYRYPSETCRIGEAIELRRVIVSDSVVLEYGNKSNQAIRPDVSMLFLNKYGAVIGSAEDDYFECCQANPRTVKGIIFDDHYVDYHYTNSLNYGMIHKFSAQKPALAAYMLVLGSDRTNMDETEEK